MCATGGYDVPEFDSHRKTGLFQNCFRYFRSIFDTTRHRLRCVATALEKEYFFKRAHTVSTTVAVQSLEVLILIRLIAWSEC